MMWRRRKETAMKLERLVVLAALAPGAAWAADFSGIWRITNVFNGNPARVDYTADLEKDGTLAGRVLRNGSASPITAVKQ
jgi:hypothetical protein